MTDLPVSHGYDSIMVTVDHGLCKGIILSPTAKKGLNAERSADLFINDIFSRFGLPEKLMTD